MHALFLEVQALRGDFMMKNENIIIELPNTTSKTAIQGIQEFFTPKSSLDNKALRLISVTMDNGQFIIKGKAKCRERH